MNYEVAWNETKQWLQEWEGQVKGHMKDFEEGSKDYVKYENIKRTIGVVLRGMEESETIYQ
jgi:hypothetical protein